MNRFVAVADIGNTTVQLAVADPGDAWPSPWSRTLELPTAEFTPSQLSPWLPPPELDWRVASVHRGAEAKLASWIQQMRPKDNYLALTHDQLPLTIRLPDPAKVGMDRLVTAVAVNRLRSARRSAIVVDAGTAITVDAIDRDGGFLGGAILPGMRMAALALSQYTDALPRVECQPNGDPPPPIGDGTKSAIRSGLVYGCGGAVREIVTRMRQQLGASAQVFTTGGDGLFCTSFIENAQHVRDLCLQGVLAAARPSGH